MNSDQSPSTQFDACRPVWHILSAEEALAALQSNADGLDHDAAQKRLQIYGANCLPETAGRSIWRRLLQQVNNVLIYVLLLAAAITAALGHWLDMTVIIAVVLVQALVGLIQEGKAEQALAAIRHMLSPQATALRDGRRQTLAAASLVPGDIVLLEAGDRVPADLRLLECRSLALDEALLTGESMPVEKHGAPLVGEPPLAERANLAWSGTLVTAGTASGVVVATGEHSEIGRISGLLAGVEQLRTPLLRQIDGFARYLSLAIVVLGALIFAGGYVWQAYPPVELFMAVVALTVAAIPEGLPAMLTITLAIGVQGMARRKAVVRRMPVIEALGAVSVICSDKTGTLTRNEMMVAALTLVARQIEVQGEGYAPEGALRQAGNNVSADADMHALAQAARLCNDASLHQVNGQWHVEGDPMEGALLAFATKAGFDREAARSWQRLDSIPFDARHRFMATLHHDHQGRHLALVKGAPEQILAMCAQQRRAGQDQALQPGYWEQQIKGLASAGMRVLALASRELPAGTREMTFADVEQQLTLLGVVGLIDPPRSEAIAAVADCRAAGIRVKMITGDHALTASAIAAQLGLENCQRVVSGEQLAWVSDTELVELAAEVDVFARTSPEDKLRLVMALQCGGQIVAMTGDGVNDAPALKRADVGIAMGRKGSAAAREAADVVLLDDNFATLVAAVRAGRTVYDNLKKSITFFLPINGGEAGSLVVALLAGLTLPITAVQILWVNMVSSLALAMSLAFEPAEPDVMQRPPRPAATKLLDRFLVWRTLLVSLLFVSGIFALYGWGMAQGYGVDLARTLAVNTLVVMEVFYLFSVRCLAISSLTWRGLAGSPAVIASVALVLALQGMFTYAPFMHQLFDSQPVAFLDGVRILAVGILLLLLLEAEKKIRQRLVTRRNR